MGFMLKIPSFRGFHSGKLLMFFFYSAFLSSALLVRLPMVYENPNQWRTENIPVGRQPILHFQQVTITLNKYVSIFIYLDPAVSPVGYNDVSIWIHCYTCWSIKLPVSFSIWAKLQHEFTLLIKHLYEIFLNYFILNWKQLSQH